VTNALNQINGRLGGRRCVSPIPKVVDLPEKRKTVTLYRAVGPRERLLIEETGWTMFPHIVGKIEVIAEFHQ
jgi:hypothetical protein